MTCRSPADRRCAWSKLITFTANNDLRSYRFGTRMHLLKLLPIFPNIFQHPVFWVQAGTLWLIRSIFWSWISAPRCVSTNHVTTSNPLQNEKCYITRRAAPREWWKRFNQYKDERGLIHWGTCWVGKPSFVKHWGFLSFCTKKIKNFGASLGRETVTSGGRLAIQQLLH